MPFRYDPTYWRERAERTRALAAATKDRDARQILLRIADDYEKLARGRDKTAPATED